MRARFRVPGLPEPHLLVLQIVASAGPGGCSWETLVAEAARVGIGEEELRRIVGE